jgi:hypothetical protein
MADFIEIGNFLNKSPFARLKQAQFSSAMGTYSGEYG